MTNEFVKNNLPSLSVQASIQEKPIPAGTASALHYHDELELIVIYEGSFSCTVFGKEYVAEPGEVIFINSRVPHSTYRKTESRMGLLQFRERDFYENDATGAVKYSMRFRSVEYTPVKIYSSSELFRAADELLCEAAARREAYGVFIKSCIFRILGLLYRDGVLADADTVCKTREVQKILPLLSHVNENYSQEITLREASASLGFDSSYFCRIFKIATGATFTEYLNFVRICKAERLLSEGEGSILEISEAVGFSSVSYFNRIFKRFRGCSPGVYRTAKYSRE